jgi:hypothetical protein
MVESVIVGMLMVGAWVWETLVAAITVTVTGKIFLK